MLNCRLLESLDQMQCEDQNHKNTSIVMILLTKDLVGKQRLLCQQCLEDNTGEIKGLPIKAAIEKIQDVKEKSFNDLKRYVENNYQQLDEMCGILQEIKSNFLMIFDQLNNSINNWKKELLNLLECNKQYSFLKEIDRLYLSNDQVIELQKSEIVEAISKIKEVYGTKLQNGISILQKNVDREKRFQKLYEIFNGNSDSFHDENEEIRKYTIKTTDQMNQEDSLFQIQQEQQQNKGQDSQIKVNEIQKKQSFLNNQINKGKSISYKIVQEIKQNKVCYAIAFNYNGTMMASAADNYIKLWKFDEGKLIDEKQILKGHENSVTVLLWSKKSDWLLSATIRGSIRFWKIKEKKGRNNIQYWECSKSYKYHDDKITCLVLNQNEDELISSSSDTKIKIWKVNDRLAQLEIFYTLQYHQDSVNSISLNSTQTQMVSCGGDKKLALWERDNNNKWQFNYVIYTQEPDQAFRISFINDDKIIWSPINEPFLNVLNLENNVFKERLNQRITLKDFRQNEKKPNFDYDLFDFLDFGQRSQVQQCFDASLFPAIFNQTLQTLLIKQNQYIYLIKTDEIMDSRLKNEPIACGTHNCFGNISNCWKYLVVWNYKTQEIVVYEIMYD